MGLEPRGRLLLIVGGITAVLGLALIVGGRVPFLGRLPGDIAIEREHLTIYIPLATMLLLERLTRQPLGLHILGVS